LEATIKQLVGQAKAQDAGLIGDHHHRPACLAGAMNQLPGTGAELHRGRITNVMAVAVLPRGD
jgi:hypothetical protein